MEVRPHAIPGSAPELVTCHVVEAIPGRRGLSLSVDPDSVARGPIQRGDGPPWMRHPNDPTRRVTAQSEQRSGFLPAVGPAPSHLARWTTSHPGRRAYAVTGCGNLGMNRGVLAATAEGRFGSPGPVGGALRVDRDGHGSWCTQEAEVSAGFLITGPLLVREGQAQPVDPPTFADPRHLVLFPYVEVKPGVRVDFGQDALLANPSLYARAALGDAIVLELSVRLPRTDAVDAPHEAHPVPAEALQQALRVKGYHESATPAERGTFRIDRESLTLCPLPGIYPHHVLARKQDGTLASVLVSGLSNRAGVRLGELAEDLAQAGVEGALLLDNGGDVGLWCAADETWLIRPAEPDRLRIWPLAACLVYHEAR